MNNSFRAQGTIEYLIIMAIVIVIGLVVVWALTNQMGSTEHVSGSVSKLGGITQGIAITESLVNPDDGDYTVRLLNNTGGSLTVSKVKIGDKDANFNENIAQSGSKFFEVSADAICTLGKVVNQELVVTYITQNGSTISERYPMQVAFDCSQYAINQSNLANQCYACGTAASGSVLSGFTFYSGSSVLQSGGLKLYANLGTGQTSCSNGSSVQVCPVGGFPGQDAERYGSSFVHSWGSATAGTILDLNSGLRWQIADNGSEVNWQSALQYCDSLSLDGYTDWYLPTASEVAQMFDYQTSTCNSVFSSCRNYYWSSTSLPNNKYYAFRLHIISVPGDVYYITKSTSTDHYVRCVRVEA